MELRNIILKRGNSPILNDVNASIVPHTITVLVGESGAGKTTLLRLIAGLEKSFTGLRMCNADELVGMVFQQLHLFPHMTVLEQVAHPLYTVHGIDRVTAYKCAEEALTSVGLAQYSARYPDELSGGQQQRVAIARAIAQRPTLLVLDEPTSGLDAGTRDNLLDLLQQFCEKYHTTIIMTTHDMSSVEKRANYVWVMDSGKIVRTYEPHSA